MIMIRSWSPLRLTLWRATSEKTFPLARNRPNFAEVPKQAWGRSKYVLTAREQSDGQQETMRRILQITKRYGSVFSSYAALLAFIFCANLSLISAASAKSFLTARNFTAPPVGATGLCSTYPWACSAKSHGNALAFSDLRRVNRAINQRIFQINDDEQYGIPEKWTLPSRRGGDCEDIALLKKYELIRRGVAPNKLLLATTLDKKLRPHAVLVFRSDHGDLVLDNAHNKILAWADTGYTFLRMQDPRNPRRWQALLRGGVAEARAGLKRSRRMAQVSQFTGARSQISPYKNGPAIDR
ncbi:transglutaminase-like cysteine peptidase [Marimonas sp. MJW-29]|uniref:Transglutaminase-like cysteine peptidase n=1 Tax=Sulfitobacter sediminis TaxID=3234186 RepID=A0ABV3RT50_9RHOB